MVTSVIILLETNLFLNQWVVDVEHLSRIAVPQPQVTYAALTKSPSA